MHSRIIMQKWSPNYAEMESNRMSFSSIPELLREGWTFHLGPAGKLSCAIRPDGTKIGLRSEYDGVHALDHEHPSPSGRAYAAYGILEYDSTPTARQGLGKQGPFILLPVAQSYEHVHIRSQGLFQSRCPNHYQPII